jgi:hypothetical protein
MLVATFRVLFLTLCGFSVCGVAQEPILGEAPEIRQVRLDHARSLLSLADEAAKRQILNDEERLLLLAARISADVVSKERSDAARARRLGVTSGGNEDTYRALLKSRAWASDRNVLLAKEARQVATTIAAYVALTRTLAPEQGEIAEAAWAEAYALDPNDRKLAAAAGARRMERLRANHLATLGVGKLELGETLYGATFAQDDLKNKVVLWRSFSL